MLNYPLLLYYYNICVLLYYSPDFKAKYSGIYFGIPAWERGVKHENFVAGTGREELWEGERL